MCVLVLLAMTRPVAAQEETVASPTDTTGQHAPEWEPYRTVRTPVAHVLAFPSYVLHYVTRPIGTAVIWAERNEVRPRLRELFWNEQHTFGVFPRATIGGATPGAVGLTVRHERLFATPREAEASFLYTSPGDYRGHVSYQNPAPFGRQSFVDADVSYRVDSDENLFLTPDLHGAVGKAGDQTSYSIEQLTVHVGVGADPLTGPGVPGVGWGLFARHERNVVGRGEGEGARRFSPQLSGAGTVRLLTSGASLLLERTRGGRRGQPRTSAGGRLFLAYDYTHVLEGSVGGYHRAVGEVQRIVPLYGLGPERRLAFRGRVERLLPTSDADIAFYELSTLGNARNLRGLQQNRLRGEGTLVLTLEYHYPIWTSWDALVFVDAGQTFDALDDVRPADLEWAGGFGLRVFAGSGVSLRLDVGFSRDGLRAFSGTDSNFTVSTRR